MELGEELVQLLGAERLRAGSMHCAGVRSEGGGFDGHSHCSLPCVWQGTKIPRSRDSAHGAPQRTPDKLATRTTAGLERLVVHRSEQGELFALQVATDLKFVTTTTEDSCNLGGHLPKVTRSRWIRPIGTHREAAPNLAIWIPVCGEQLLECRERQRATRLRDEVRREKVSLSAHSGNRVKTGIALGPTRDARGLSCATPWVFVRLLKQRVRPTGNRHGTAPTDALGG